MHEDVDKSGQPFFADSGHVLVASDEMVGLLESFPFVSFFGMEPGGVGMSFWLVFITLGIHVCH